MDNLPTVRLGSRRYAHELDRFILRTLLRKGKKQKRCIRPSLVGNMLVIQLEAQTHLWITGTGFATDGITVFF